MKDIVIIANFCRDFSESDNGRFMYLCKELSKNHKVEIITSDFSHATKKPKEPLTHEWPFVITFLHEPGYDKNVSLKRFYSHYMWGKKVEKYLKIRKKPDVIYCAIPSLTAASKVAQYCKKNDVKLIADIQDLWPEAYVRCILGKCKVTDMMSQLAEITEQMKDYNITILQLTGKIDELTLKVDEMTGDVVSIGKCGENINFTLFSDGKLILKGTGAMFDYDNGSNASPFKDNTDIKSVIVSEGITSIGEYAFQYCNNLKTAVLPTTLKTIKRNSFMPHIDEYIVHQNLYGLIEITIPAGVNEIARNACSGTSIKSVTIPSSVSVVGEMAFSECQKLETVRYSGKIISDRMFVHCIKLKNFTITKSTTEIFGGCFNYCESLTFITYEGTVSEWLAINKHTNWDGHSSSTVDSPLTKIQCLDGYMEYDAENKVWNEVKT